MAFIVGGIICTIGQVLINLLMYLGLNKDTSIGYQNLILIGTAILLTGLNVYSKIAKHGGAGSLVPITGFVNSVGACAIEFKVWNGKHRYRLSILWGLIRSANCNLFRCC